MLKKMCISM